MEEAMRLVVIDDQKGEVDILFLLAKKHGFNPAEHEISIVWQIDGIRHAVEQAIRNVPDAIFVDWQFDDQHHPIPKGITGAGIVSALRAAGYTGPIYSHSSSGVENFEKAGVANLMGHEATNKKAEKFAQIVASLAS